MCINYGVIVTPGQQSIYGVVVTPGQQSIYGVVVTPCQQSIYGVVVTPRIPVCVSAKILESNGYCINIVKWISIINTYNECFLSTQLLRTIDTLNYL